MNLENKVIDLSIKAFKPKYWNFLSYVISSFSKPTIGSPLAFDGPMGLRLQEYLHFDDMPHAVKEEFVDFCYPLDMPQRQKEIECDLQYLPHASIFLVFYQDTIAGCAMYIIKKNGNKLPIEYATIVSSEKKEQKFHVPDNGKGINAVEIYRLRKSFSINNRIAVHVPNMIFKAVWAKSVQIKAMNMYLSCTGNSNQVKNIYQSRLAFEDLQCTVTYDGKSQWRILKKDNTWHEYKFATLSKRHFLIQTYFRKNLQNKSLYPPQPVSVLLYTPIKALKLPIRGAIKQVAEIYPVLKGTQVKQSEKAGKLNYVYFDISELS